MKQNKIPKNEYIIQPKGKTNPYRHDVDYKSKMGYRDDSPYNQNAYNDIHTPNGMIDMSQTGIPLFANGQYLPPYSGMHYLGSPIVREIPANQFPIVRYGGGLPRAQNGRAQTPEAWEKEIRTVEHKIGHPSQWTLEGYKELQNKLNEYKAWRENTPQGKAVIDYHNEPNEYVIPLPDHLKDSGMNYEKDLISKVLMNRNRDKDFVKRAYDVGAYPDSNMFIRPDDNEFGQKNSHLMEWGTDDSGQAWMYPSVMNPTNEAIKVPNQYADYISSEGYKKATGMIPEKPFGGQNTKTHTHMKGGGSLNRKVTCSNCGWSWKLVDGGTDPMTCHKCGGTIKMQNGGWLDKLPEAQLGRIVKAGLKGIKKLNPVRVADKVVPQVGGLLNPAVLMGVEDMNAMSMSPLNWIPGYGKKLKGEGQAFRKFGNSIDDVIERQALSPKGRTNPLGGTSRFVDEGNWGAMKEPNEKYSGVFLANMNPEIKGSNINLSSIIRREGVVGTTKSGNVDIPLNDEGLSFYRRLPFSNKYVPINKEKLIKKEFDLARTAPHLQSLAEKALGAAGVIAVHDYMQGDDKSDWFPQIKNQLDKSYNKVSKYVGPYLPKEEEGGWLDTMQDGGTDSGVATRQDSMNVYNSAMQSKVFYNGLKDFYREPYIDAKNTKYDDFGLIKTLEKENLDNSDLSRANKEIIKNNKNKNVAYVSDLITGMIDPRAPLITIDNRIKHQGTISYTPINAKDEAYQKLTGKTMKEDPKGFAEFEIGVTKNPLLKKAIQKRNNQVYNNLPGNNTVIPYYDPIAVKPNDLLTEEERIERINKYGYKGLPVKKQVALNSDTTRHWNFNGANPVMEYYDKAGKPLYQEYFKDMNNFAKGKKIEPIIINNQTSKKVEAKLVNKKEGGWLNQYAPGGEKPWGEMTVKERTAYLNAKDALKEQHKKADIQANEAERQSREQAKKEHYKDWVAENYEQGAMNPLFQTVAGFTPFGSIPYAMQSAASAVNNLAQGNYLGAGIDAAFSTPLFKGLKGAKKIIPKTKPITGKMEGIGDIKDLSEINKIDKYGFKAHPDLFNKKYQTAKDAKQFDYHGPYNPSGRYVGPTEGDKLSGYTDVPEFNQELNNMLTKLQYGKRPLGKNVKTSPTTSKNALWEALDNARYEEGMTDLIPTQYMKQANIPYSGKKVFQNVQPNKYGGDIEKAQWGKIIKKGIKSLAIDDAVRVIKNKIAQQKSDTYHIIRNLRADKPNPNKYLSGEKTLSKEEMEFRSKYPPIENAGYYEKPNDPNYLYNFQTYKQPPLEERFKNYKKEDGGWLDDEYRRGGQKKSKHYTSKNIQSSVNDLFMRNETLFGPAGKKRYKPGLKYKSGGNWLDNLT